MPVFRLALVPLTMAHYCGHILELFRVKDIIVLLLLLLMCIHAELLECREDWNLLSLARLGHSLGLSLEQVNHVTFAGYIES